MVQQDQNSKCRVHSKEELEGYIQERRRWDELSSKVSEIESGVHQLEKILEQKLDQRLQHVLRL